VTRSRALLWLLAVALLVLLGIVARIATTTAWRPSEVRPSVTDAKPAATAPLVFSQSSEAEREGLADQPPKTTVRELVSVVFGTVHWPEGQPTEGAEVVVTTASGKAGAPKAEHDWIDHASEDGTFRIEGLREGSYVLVVRSIRRDTSDSSITLGWWLATTRFQMPRADPMDLVLGPVESIHGRVVASDRQSLNGFDISAAPSFGSRDLDDGRTPFDWHFGSPDGSFEFFGMLPGTWEVWVEAEGYAPVRPRTIEVPRREPVDFELVHTIELNGRVVDQAGEHLRAVAKATWADSGDSIAAGTSSDHTWGDGLFRVRVPPTVVELRASCDGLESQPVTLDVTRGASRERIIVVIPRKQ